MKTQLTAEAELANAIERFYKKTGNFIEHAVGMNNMGGGIIPKFVAIDDKNYLIFSPEFLYLTNSREKEFFIARSFIVNQNNEFRGAGLIPSIIATGTVLAEQESRALYFATTSQYTEALAAQTVAAMAAIGTGILLRYQNKSATKEILHNDRAAIELSKDPLGAIEALKKLHDSNLSNAKNWFDFKDFSFKEPFSKTIEKFIVEKLFEPVKALTNPSSKVRIQAIENSFKRELAGQRGLN